jgi:endonuclease/exonuclease/phosphatase family metal-dependent hydrolase
VSILAGIAATVAGSWIGPEHIGVLALIQYVPFPAFLIPAIVAVGLSIGLSRVWRAAAVLGVAVVATLVMGLEIHRGESGSNAVRLMTYNIKSYDAVERAGGLDTIADEIARHNPDILVLQDARQLTQAQTAERETAPGIFGDRQVYAFGQYVIASRFPLRDCHEAFMSLRTETHTYVACLVVAHGVEFELVTAHFITPRFGLNATRALRGLTEWNENVADRMMQAETLARDISIHLRPIVVAGDFNASEHSLAVRTLLDTGLRDAFSVAGVGYGYTFGHSLRLRFSFLRLDHILVGPEFAVADCFVGGAAGSTHRPVVADLYLTRR